MAEPLVEVTRGPSVESFHRGHLVAVEGGGRLVARLGSGAAVAFMRSATKPFQALPLVASGAADRFGFVGRELAIACGSHNGERAHTDAVRSMLSKAGLSVSDLRCGAHEPYGKGAAEELRAKGERPTALHNNCSGKHAGMLALALHLGAPTVDYLKPESPVQRAVFRAVSHYAEVPEAELEFATDGCGVPTFALTIEQMARMFARLVAHADADARLGEELRGVVCRESAQRVLSVMLAYPEMVEGEGELDTELMRAGAGRFVSKVGAEGVYAAGVLPCERWPKGLGLAFKIEDGDKGDRARNVAAVASLGRLGVLGDAELKSLAAFAHKTLTNHRGDEVGEVRPSQALSSLQLEV
ncbi:MAG TPA: asparaginase [Pyrinomonadaceae bacterium]|nr:asparaginase [Pyrinomonadaceae bacterium]